MSDLFMDETFHCKWHFTGIESQKKFLKNCSKSIPQGKIFVSQGHNEIAVVICISICVLSLRVKYSPDNFCLKFLKKVIPSV